MERPRSAITGMFPPRNMGGTYDAEDGGRVRAAVSGADRPEVPLVLARIRLRVPDRPDFRG